MRGSHSKAKLNITPSNTTQMSAGERLGVDRSTLNQVHKDLTLANQSKDWGAKLPAYYGAEKANLERSRGAKV